jgi:hypothetical protein
MSKDFVIKLDGGSSRSDFPGLQFGGGGGSYSSSGGIPICCIGIILLIILGLVLNFIFHLELWLIGVILIISFVIGIILLNL